MIGSDPTRKKEKLPSMLRTPLTTIVLAQGLTMLKIFSRGTVL